MKTYLVHTIETTRGCYSIEARTKKEAQKKAKEKFAFAEKFQDNWSYKIVAIEKK